MSRQIKSIRVGSNQIGVTGLLLVAFVVLKLCHVIDWSWWWVTAPAWGGLAFVLAVMAAVGIFLGGAAGLDAIGRARRRRRNRTA